MSLLKSFADAVSQTFGMAFVPENKQMTYRGGTQGYCIVCGAPVAWLRPKGIAVFCGAVAMADVTDSAVESMANKTTGAIAYRVVAYRVRDGAKLHDCKPINEIKYGATFKALCDGTLKADPAVFAAHGTPVRRGRRGKAEMAAARAAGAAATEAARAALRAPEVTYPSASPSPFETTEVKTETAPPVTPPKSKAVPDPALPPAAAYAWKRADAIVRKTKIHRILLYGPPGTGKTTFPHRLAEELGAACYSITLTEETPAAALVGQFVIKGGDVAWLDGAATRAMKESHKRPVFLVLNEIDHASGDAMTKLIEIMDDASLVAIYLPTGEVVRPNPANWRIVATTNAEPNALIPAVTDRLHANVCITHPHPGLIASLFTMEAKRLLCAASREFSVRSVMSWDSLVRDGMTMKDAAEIVFEPAAAQALLDAARLSGASI